MWEMSARLTVRKSSLLKFITVSSAVCRAGRANKQFLTENPNLQNNLTVNITLVGVYRVGFSSIVLPSLTAFTVNSVDGIMLDTEVISKLSSSCNINTSVSDVYIPNVEMPVLRNAA